MSLDQTEQKLSLLQKILNEKLLDACREGDYYKAKQAIEDGANVNNLDNSGFGPIHYATAFLHYDLIALLAGKGVEINLKTKKGVTPLEVVRSLKSKQESTMVNLLKHYGATECPRI
jgi:ankyrin repeat protein